MNWVRDLSLPKPNLWQETRLDLTIRGDSKIYLAKVGRSNSETVKVGDWVTWFPYIDFEDICLGNVSEEEAKKKAIATHMKRLREIIEDKQLMLSSIEGLVRRG